MRTMNTIVLVGIIYVILPQQIGTFEATQNEKQRTDVNHSELEVNLQNSCYGRFCDNQGVNDVSATKEVSKAQQNEENKLTPKRILNTDVLSPKTRGSNSELEFSEESRENQNRRQPTKESEFRADFVEKSTLPFHFRSGYGISPYVNLDKDLVMYKFEIDEDSLVERGPRNFGFRTSYTNQYTDGIPGVQGKDYPIYSSVPYTGFSCFGKRGLFVDTAARCQVFYVCQNEVERSTAHLCPNGTVFNHKYSICDWWYNVKCVETRPRNQYWYLGLAEKRPDITSTLREPASAQTSARISFPAPPTLAPSFHLSAHGALPPFILRALRRKQIEEETRKT